MNLNPIPGLKNFYSNSKYVMSTSYKPDTEAFKRTLKIVLLGIIVLGVIGFLISFVINQLVLAAP